MPDPYKTALRNTIKQIRANLSLEYRLRASQQVCIRITHLDAYRQAKHIALYRAVSGEIDVTPIWNSATHQDKYCYFPMLRSDKQLIFLPASPKTPFKANRFGILEPDVSPDMALAVSQFDLIILPLVAFDEWGTRLGMGAGFYDRSLGSGMNCHQTLEVREKPRLIGVGYDFQKFSYIDPNPWDIPLDLGVTPSGVYPK